MSKFDKPRKRAKKSLRIKKIIRQSVIDRDSGLCQICGKEATQVHHCLYKSYQGSNIAQNLICLCSSCHLKVHSKGKYWFPILLKLQQRHYPNLTKQDLKK